MSNTTFNQIAPLLRDRWGNKQAQLIMDEAIKRFHVLCDENASDSKAIKAHTEQKIYPCISLYESMKHQGISSHEAQEFLDWALSECAKPGAQLISRIVHLCGLYNLYPAIFSLVAKQSFGTAAGFRATFYKRGFRRSRFDMTECLYCDICRKYGCPELTQCFCHVDDVNNGDLHPRLCWNRSQCMGEGGSYCDFDIYVKKKR